MFEVDNCKVYRFTDQSEYRYFVNCPTTVTTSWTEKKSTTTVDGEGHVHTDTTEYPKYIMVEKLEEKKKWNTFCNVVCLSIFIPPLNFLLY